MAQWSISDRPKTFSDMEGCQKVKDYFYNIVKKGEDFPNQVVFQGLTGSGKTTAAKIAACMMVCKNPKGNGDPCCECPDCKAVIDETFGRSVMQIDGSNASKDDIVSNLSQFLLTPSMMNARKVVLVEEAQELSGPAQKAVLKLSEMPRKGIHLIFTTMTGQGGKRLPSAVMNRGPRFWFNSVSHSDMMMFLRKTLTKHPEVLAEMPDLTAEQQNEFFEAVTTNSYGSYRQGLQLLEQCILSNTYTAKDIAKEFGLIDEASFYQIMLDMLNGKMTPESFETLTEGDANKLASVFSLAYKVIADAECYRLFGKVPNIDEDDDFRMKQAKEIAAHPKFPYMRDTYYEFAQYEKLMPSNIRMLVCKVFEACSRPPANPKLYESKPIVTEPKVEEKVVTTPSFDNLKEVETTSIPTTEPTSGRRVIRR